jgi:hypothetical protein
MHYKDERGEKLYVFFMCRAWVGIPENNETEKCSEIAWFSINDLPINTIDHIKTAIGLILNGTTLTEYGF